MTERGHAPDLRTPIADLEIVALDVETTGLYQASDRVIEWGAVCFQGDQVLSEFSELADPGMPIPPEASRISGITDAALKGARPTDLVARNLLAFIGARVVIAHNADFDLGFLRASVQRLGIPEPRNLILDTIALSRKAFPGQRSYALQALREFLQIPENSAHRARDDAETCMRVFVACVKELSFMGDLSLGELLV